MSADPTPNTPSEAALAVALRALVLVTVEADRGRRISIASVADRRIRAALDRHRAQVEADAAVVGILAQLGGAR